MFAGRVSQFTVALAAALALTTAADASTVTYTQNYGSNADRVAPIHGTDNERGRLKSDHVVVSDQDRWEVDKHGNITGGVAPFFDSLRFAGISGTITELALTLTYSDAPLDCSPSCGYFTIFGKKISLNGSGEQWLIYADDDTPTKVTLGTLDGKSESTATIFFSNSSYASVFNSALAKESLGYYFGDEAGGSNTFKLYSASLTVTYDAAPVPLPAGGLLLLGALGGFAALARRKRAA